MKAPSLFVSLLFVAVAVFAVLLGNADTIAVLYTGAVSLVTAGWRLWQEYREPVEFHTMDRDLSRGKFARLFWVFWS